MSSNMHGSIYDNIGDGYNSTRRADAYIVDRLIFFLKPQPEMHYLDIGCGTGNYTVALHNMGLKITGVDPSERMLNEAKNRGENIEWIIGNAENIPVGNETFDGVVATLTIHHWQNLGKALMEVNRVLKRGGRFILFTSTPEQMKGYWLNHYFPHMMHESILQMPSLEIIRQAVSTSGLRIAGTEKYFIRDGQQDYFLYAGKNKPNLYFDENIRRGISSFSSIANKNEVESGLLKLRNDIEDKSFEKIKASYENREGDYLFIQILKDYTIHK